MNTNRVIYACAYHVHNVCNENFCCCPITREHSKALVKCPKRFFEVFDEEGNNVDGYKPDTMICTKRKDIADQHFTSHPVYIAPSKRQRVYTIYNTLYILSFLFKQQVLWPYKCCVYTLSQSSPLQVRKNFIGYDLFVMIYCSLSGTLISKIRPPM